MYFSEQETKGLDPRLVEKLEKARGLAGVPFIINEGRASGGSHVKDTAHADGLAVDISCTSSRNRMKIVAAALMTGFNRIGVYNKHIHLDISTTLPQEVMWWGVSK